MHVLSVSSLKGGVGKTTVTLGLASAAFSRGLRTLVVDFDPQSDVSTGLAVNPDGYATVADVLESPKEKTVRSAIAHSGWNEYHEGGSIDLLVAEPSLFAVAATDRALRAIEEIRRGVSPRLQPLGILINRTQPQSMEHQFRIRELREMFGPLVLNPQLPERPSLQQAQGAAKPVHMWPGEASQEMAGNFDLVLDRVLRSAGMDAARETRSKPGRTATVVED